jgi:beta-1,2-mannobiose phosphorylase / 1,2-beta-oligomannan phosphorylase
MKRHLKNPIITPDMVKPSAQGYRVRGTFNPAVTRFNNEIILLLRVAEDCLPRKGRVVVPKVNIENGIGTADVLDVSLEDSHVKLKDTRGVVYKGVDYLTTMSHLRIARSKDGVHFTVEQTPFLFPSHPSEVFGLEDARITQIGKDYYINYTCVSPDGWATALAVTSDFKSIQRKGIIFPPQNKDVSIFPQKINGRYCALHRPNNEGFGKPSIWYADSPDLIHWGNHHCILRPRDILWEEQKIGGGAPSLKTDQGWLQIYHGKGRNQIYSLFTVLLDLKNPTKVLKRATQPFFKPEVTYEKEGFFNNVVFSNGLFAFENGRVLIYYGSCDQFTCLVETSIDELLSTL